jgi:hypothetical protein
MPPKKGKAKGGGDDDDESPSGTCNQVKVRHILCEKQSKVLEALKEITGYTKEDGTQVEPVKFNQVAMKYSEDKAKEVRAPQRNSGLAMALRPALTSRSAGRQPGVEAARRAQRRLRRGGVQARQGQGASQLPRRRIRAALTVQPLARAPQMTPQPIKTSFGYHLILVVRALRRLRCTSTCADFTLARMCRRTAKLSDAQPCKAAAPIQLPAVPVLCSAPRRARSGAHTTRPSPDLRDRRMARRQRLRGAQPRAA